METRSPYNIPIAKPFFTGNEAELVQQALNSGWVSQGPLVEQFEQAIATYTKANYAVATSSCTTSLHVSMLIHGIGYGDDVICPSYSFIATANGIRHAGAQPQFVDIDPATLNIDPAATQAYIEANYTTEMLHKLSGNRLKAILIVHQIGIPADIDKFADIAKRFGLAIIEDSACALGSKYKNQPIGASGNTGALSFHPRKVITTGEGGMLLLGQESLAEKARIYRAHGASISDFARHKSSSTVYESYEVIGYNYRMTDIQAAIGLKQLETLENLIEQRRTIAEAYNKAFAQLDELEIICPPEYVTRWNYQSYPIRLTRGSVASRDAIMQLLHDKGVTTRRGIPPIHKEPVYDQGQTLPQTESVSKRSLFLPIFAQLTEDEIRHIIDSVKQSCLPTVCAT
ncbi:MAG: DegT/DnrJ/EryC1/StrS family aminotransferase [Candidatus Melainabacteria bacterium]|nr:DegT/DnrJ/EryC1/StrS family aminotransferase [Candidatus Melainabacteria bacterium]